MRIGIFTDYYLPSIGGTEISIANYKAELERLGHEVYIFTSKIGPAPDEDQVIHLPKVPVLFSPVPIILNYPGLAKKIAADYQLDIVHSHTQFGAFWLAHHVARRLGVPHVSILHTLYKNNLETTILGLKGFTFFSILIAMYQQLQMLFVPQKGLNKPLYQSDDRLGDKILWNWLFRQFQLVSQVLVPTEYATRLISERGFAGAQVQPNFVPSKHYVLPDDIKTRLASPKPVVRFVSCSQHRPEKRLDVFLNALALLPKDLAWQAVIVGDGAEEDRLKQQAQDSGISEKVVFLGRLGNEDTQAVVSFCDVSVLVSHNFDLQPMNVLESLSNGVPVLYCDPRISQDCYLTPDNSLLCDPDANSISEACRKLIVDASFRGKLRSGTKATKEKIGGGTLAKRLVDIYKHAEAQNKVKEILSSAE